MPGAELFVIVLEAYAATGLLFAFVFVTVGIKRVDPLSRGSGIGFRLMILPGITALWPVMLTRWIRCKEYVK
jgi:hypothetical protein